MWGPIVAAEPAEDRPPRALAPPPQPPSPFAPARPDGRVRVGFAGPVYLAHGGTETWHHTLLPRLDALGVQVAGYAVLSRAEGPEAPLGCPLGSGPEAIRTLARSVDVLVVWGLDGLSGLLGDLDARPVVVAVSHGDTRVDWTTRILRECEPVTDRYVGVSSSAVQAVPESRRAEAVVIPNAVDPARLRAARSRDEVRAELGLAPEDVAVLWHHRLSKEKRPLLAVEAIRAAGPPFVLLLAGDGERSAVEAAAAGEPRVRLLGSSHDVGGLLAASDLALSTSETDGFGFSMAEALWAGVPLIATPLGLLEGHEDLARIVPVEAGADAWAEAVRADWADADARRRRAEIARAFARDAFDPDAFARRWADLIRETAQRHRQSSGPAPGSGARATASAEPPLPSKARMARQLLGAVVDTVTHAVTTGEVRAPAEEQERRWSICRACDHFRPSDQRCGKLEGCGCHLPAKIPLAALHCPIGKW